TQALRRHLEHSGGTVLTGGAVTAIETERGAVRGVRLRDGTVIEARAVLSAIDPRTTLLRAYPTSRHTMRTAANCTRAR
ncbi:MAG: hypothetical protein E6J81_17615, partial [Deltaproteobacteria bacterium]